MNHGLHIRPEGGLDLVSLGALVHRFDPGHVPFHKAHEYSVHVSGGEFNVAANLSDCFRLKTGIVSAIVDYPVGALVAERVRAMGVQPFYKRFEHNGVNGPNMAAVYSDRGFGVRAPVVFYNRSNEAAARLQPGDFDWGTIFSGGVRWFHSGGIFAALSETTPDVIIEGMQAARAAGAVVSFDLNFRPKLWQISGGQRRAAEVISRIVENVDVLVGNEEDLQNGLGIPGPAVASESEMDSTAFFGMIGRVVERHPRIKIVVTTLREVRSTNRHRWGAVGWVNGETHVVPTCELDVFDRVGGGDGFAAGFFYGLLAGEAPEAAMRLGWAHGALMTTFPGDTTMATLEQVRSFARGRLSKDSTLMPGLNENPFAVLTAVVAPAILTNACSVLALGTANRIARVVDRTRVLTAARNSLAAGSPDHQIRSRQLQQLEARGNLLLRALRNFYAALGAFAASALAAIAGSAMAAYDFQAAFHAVAVLGFLVGAGGVSTLVLGCVRMVRETRVAITSMTEEVELARARDGEGPV